MKPAMVFVSGWSFDPADLEPLASVLQDRFELSILPAVPARGIPPEDLGARGGHEPVFIGGWSIGGMLALEAAAAGARAAGLLLVSSTVRFCEGAGEPPGAPEREIRSLALALRKDPAAALARFRRQCALPHEAGGPTRERSAHDAERTEVLLQGLEYLRTKDLRGQWEALRIPRVVLHGREDRIIPVAAAEWLGSRAPSAAVHVVGGVGHDLPLRCPGEVLRAALDLQRISS